MKQKTNETQTTAVSMYANLKLKIRNAYIYIVTGNNKFKIIIVIFNIEERSSVVLRKKNRRINELIMLAPFSFFFLFWSDTI